MPKTKQERMPDSSGATAQQQGLLRKYRAIFIAVGLFLLFDMSILGINFYSSFQIKDYAVSINLAGRQRMLSQRMTKVLLSLQGESDDAQRQRDFDELKLVVPMFDTTLEGFRIGDQVTGGDGKPTELKRVETESGQSIVLRAQEIWKPYQAALRPLIDASTPPDADDARLADAARYARANNLQLLGLMNDLTSDLENTADNKALTLRWIQAFGIVAALINFIYTVFMAIRDLVEGDRKLEQARKETDEILSTVKEGLFLLDPDCRFGSQHSASLGGILRRDIREGDEFLPVLRALVPEDVHAATHDYIELLFGDRVKEALILSLNPLNQVEVNFEDARGQNRQRYLSFHFNRVLSEGRISHLLVTVQDVTEQVHLAGELEKARSQASEEVNALLKLMNSDMQALRHFLENAETTLNGINAALGSDDDTERARTHIINQLLRGVHGIKGEAAALGIDMIETYAHNFEREVIAMRDRGDLSGDDMVRITVQLDGFYDQIASIQRISTLTPSEQVRQTSAPGRARQFTESLQALAERIATDQQKQVRLEADLDVIDNLPHTVRDGIEHIAVQLLRNAVTHGIEAPDERERHDKPAEGSIQLQCEPVSGGEFRFIFRDDGRGVSLQQIRDSLVHKQLADEETARGLNEQDLLLKLFEPGFSTAQTAGKDAGHGIGLDIVAAKVAELRGRLRLVSRMDEFTEFHIQFSAT